MKLNLFLTPVSFAPHSTILSIGLVILLLMTSGSCKDLTRVSGQVPIDEDLGFEGRTTRTSDKVTVISSRGIPYERMIQRTKGATEP